MSGDTPDCERKKGPPMTEQTTQPDFEVMARDVLGFYFCNKDMEASWMPEVRERLAASLRQAYQAGLLEAAKVTEGYPAYNHITARIKERAASMGGSKNG